MLAHSILNLFLFDFYGQRFKCAAADICLQQFDFIKLTVPYVQLPGFSFKINNIERLL